MNAQASLAAVASQAVIYQLAEHQKFGLGNEDFQGMKTAILMTVAGAVAYKAIAGGSLVRSLILSAGSTAVMVLAQNALKR